MFEDTKWVFWSRKLKKDRQSKDRLSNDQKIKDQIINNDL